MKNISTLIKDIQARLTSSQPFDEETVSAFAHSLAKKLADRLASEHKPSLRLSNLGTACDRKLWYSINHPELAEPLPASTRFKFLFGDVIEELVMFLARAAGHTVTDEQKEVTINGVRGHIDGRIDGHLVDVKSASSYGYKKFAEHNLEADDPFGYLTQIGAYAHAERDSKASFIAVEKQLGHICIDTYELKPTDFIAVVDTKRAMLSDTKLPKRGYMDIPEGKSGNRKLDIACSYCPFKVPCWPGLRGFKYARGPIFLTAVERLPDVPELRLDGTEREK